MENEILQILLSSLKVQAEKMKELIGDSTLSYEQRKNFDTEISEMYNVLASLSNTSIVYSLSEIKILKDTYQSELDKFLESLSNIDLSSITLTPEQIANLKGENGLSAYQIAVNNGFEGSQSEWLDSLKGSNFSFEDLTQEQKDTLKGENGLSAYQIAVNNGFEGSQSEWLDSLKGSNFSFEDLTQEQKDTLKGENGLSAYQIAVNNGFEGSESEWLNSLKGSDTEAFQLPIEISEVNELGSTLSQIFQSLSELQGLVNGGTISGVNINQLNSQFQSFKSSSTSQLDYIMKILQGGELYNVALETTIQYDGLMNIVESLKSRITDLENNS